MTAFLPGGRLGLLLVASAILLAGASGCLTGDDPAGEDADSERSDSADTTAGSGPPDGWSLRACNGYSVQGEIPADATRDSLPEGFEPAGDDPVGQGQRLFVDVYDCREAVLEGEALGESRLLTAKVEVEPPADLQRSDDASHFLYLAILTGSEPLAEAIQAAGLPARNASPTIDTLGGQARVGTGEAAHEDAGGQVRVATGNLTANELGLGAEESRVFGLDRPLGADGTPRVTTVVDRELSATNVTVGQGNWTLSGPVLPDAFPDGGEGLGFDTQEGTYGKTFRVVRSLGPGEGGGTEPSFRALPLAAP